MALSRRQIFHSIAGLGIGSVAFQKALAVQVQEKAKTDAPEITIAMLEQAEWITGVQLSEADRKKILSSVRGQQRTIDALRKQPVPNEVSPAFAFHPLGAHLPAADAKSAPVTLRKIDFKKPGTEEELAFCSITQLGHLLRTKQVTSTELTKLYLTRLKKYDPKLLCVVSLTEELALKQAKQADEELSQGKDRGPLHGIPWGAKDLMSYPGYKTTWGAGPYKDQTLDSKSTVAQKLDDAGAVLVAKLTLGALAMGDLWFGGMTRNPWNPKVGSSGSSAGSASAAVAGLVGFAIGTETLGSIVSPCTRCGATGLRPTFGRVSRAGCMALSWTMDKLGPITRSVEDCAIVFSIIHGADPLDNSTVNRSFHWPVKKDLKDYKVGYVETQRINPDRPDLAELKKLGVQLVPIKMPSKINAGALRTILNVEAGAAFDELTRKGITEGIGVWPDTFRPAQFVSAIEYIRANRLRTQLMQEMEECIKDVDLYVGGNDLMITNLTGHPTVVMPFGFRKTDDGETPSAITFTGKLYGEADLLHVTQAVQEATGHHLKHPNLDKA